MSEQILIRHLPDGTKALLGHRARAAGRSMEAEARDILTHALAPAPDSITDVLAMPDGDDIDFEPDPLELHARIVEI